MISECILPDNPLEFIRQCIKKQKIRWTYHVNMRLQDRFIPRQVILEAIDNYEIIEEYPKDKYLPSYLIYSRCQNYIFHVLFAVDVEGDNIYVVTAYYPSINEWEKDLKTRRRSL